MPQPAFAPLQFIVLKKNSVRGTLIASFLLLVMLLAGVAVAGILNLDRSRATVERIYNTELLGLSAVKQANAKLLHIDWMLGSMALARTLAERDEIARRLDGYRADVREHLEVARPLFLAGGGQALFVAVELAVRRYEETIPEAMSRLAREEPGSSRDGIAYLFDEVRPCSHDACDGLNDLARHKELVTEQYKLALLENYRGNRRLMLVLCAASVVVVLGLGVPLAGGNAAGEGAAGSIEPMRRSLAAQVRLLARHADADAAGKDIRGPVGASGETGAERAGPVERFRGRAAAPGRERARLPNAADMAQHTPAHEGA